YDYTPYGERITRHEASGYTACDIGFTGHITLPSLISGQAELLLAHYRAYDPWLGRWLSTDPLGEEDGSNLYAYVHGCPTFYKDTTGLKTYIFLLGEDSNGLPLEKAAAFLANMIELGKDDKIVTKHICGFNDFNTALKSNSDISQITYIGHGGPGILFIGMGTGSDTNITEAGGEHSMGDNVFKSRSLKELDRSNVLNNAEINLYSCYSGMPGWNHSGLARSFSDYFGAFSSGGFWGTKFRKTGEPYTFGGYCRIHVFPSSRYMDEQKGAK
ncbi:MAG: RHS repeat-associated core domain-containing protein, partial [Verrucomicrobiota bacterium]